MSMFPLDDDVYRQMMAIARRKRNEELGRLLMEEPAERNEIDERLEDPGIREWVSGRDPEEPVEFVEHQCWRMLYVWPDEADPTLPGRVECSGCGMVGRFEVEYKP